MDSTSTNSVDSRDLLEVLFRNKGKIVLIPTVFIALGVAIILFAPRKYLSESKIMLRVGRESVGIDPTATTGQTMMLQQNGRDSEVQSAIDLLLSRGLAEKVVDDLGPEYILEGGPPGSGDSNPVAKLVMAPIKKVIELVKNIDEISEREKAIIEFNENLSVKAERDSTVIVADYESDTAEGAQHILQGVVRIYREEYIRSFRNPQSRSFFEEQRKLLHDQLDQADQGVRDAKNRMGLASINGRRGTYEAQLSAIELGVYDTEQNHSTATARISDLRKQLSDLPARLVSSKTSKPNQGADLLREQLYALQVKQIDLKARYSDDHPLVKAVSAQVAKAKEIVDDQVENRQETVDDVNPVHRELTLALKRQETEAAGLAARLKTLDEQKRLVMSDLKQLNRYEVELSELKRAAQLANDKFFKYSNSFEQARIDEALEEHRISSLSVPQPATLQEKPVSPSKTLVGLGSLLLALGATVGCIAVSENLGAKVRTPQEVERELGLPVFADIPESRRHGRVLHH